MPPKEVEVVVCLVEGGEADRDKEARESAAVFEASLVRRVKSWDQGMREITHKRWEQASRASLSLLLVFPVDPRRRWCFVEGEDSNVGCCRGEGEAPREAAAMDRESRLVTASDC